MNNFYKIMAGLAFIFCFFAGLYLVANSKDDNVLTTSIGLYFIGKSFFVGPMLWLTSERLKK